jgi:hypothetical protein
MSAMRYAVNSTRASRFFRPATLLIFLGILSTALNGCAPSDTWPAGLSDADRQMLAAAPLEVHPWADGPANGVIIFTAHYRIHTDLDDPAVRQMMARVLEADYARFMQLVPNAGPLPLLNGYVFNNREEWEEYVVENTGNQATTYLHIALGGFTRRGVFATYRGTTEEVLSVVAHEAWHQFSYWVLKDHLPAWIDEGLGTQNEQMRWENGEPVFTPWLNQERWEALYNAVKTNNLLPLEEFARIQAGDVVVLPEQDVQDYYAELWSFTLYLESSSYRQNLLAFLDAARKGKLSPLLAGSGLTPQEIAIQSIQWNRVSGLIYMKVFFGPDLENLHLGYLTFVRQLIAAWPPAQPDDTDTLLGSVRPTITSKAGGPM